MKDNLLEVGDIVYQYGNYGIYEKHEVERVTPTQAILKGQRLKIGRLLRTYGDCLRTDEIGGMEATRGLHWYLLENDVLIKKWFKKSSLEMLKTYPFHKLDHETLVSLIKLLPNDL